MHLTQVDCNQAANTSVQMLSAELEAAAESYLKIKQKQLELGALIAANSPVKAKLPSNLPISKPSNRGRHGLNIWSEDEIAIVVAGLDLLRFF